jgi:restriction system protein
MSRRRGFFAELNHQAQLAEKRRQQQARAAARAQATAQRQAEQAQRAAERAARAAASTEQAQRQAAEREAAAAYVAAQQALADAMTAGVQQTYSEIDGILAATLGVDDHLDLETLRVTSVEHPPFDGGPDAQPLPPPAQPNYPPNPIWQEPPAPTGMAARLGGMRRHQEAVTKARAAYEDAVAAARTQAEAMYADFQRRMEGYQQAERARLARLAERRAAYDGECEEREAEAAERNSQLDKLINDLAFDVPWAI